MFKNSIGVNGIIFVILFSIYKKFSLKSKEERKK